MNRELIKLIMERFALLNGLNETSAASETISELIPVDFDFDTDNKTKFDTYLSLQYFWNDWKPPFLEVF